MSGLSVGIVGLPNVGKSTLFNALLKKQVAYVANFPFATIEPNVGVVPVPDERLEKLAQVVKESENMDHLPPEVPATVEFVDIAGLIAGASKGEGLGNKFLSNIRGCQAICHVLRAFKDEDIIKQGVSDPVSDFETVKTELDLADLESQERREKKKGKIIEELPLFKNKPILVVLNVDEGDLKDTTKLEEEYAQKLKVNPSSVVAICAKVESELASLPETDQKEYLKSFGVDKSGLERLIKKTFSTLNLITFLTAGAKEVRAWTIKKQTLAPLAAATIHTDFEKHFIKAEIIKLTDFISYDGWKGCREKGKVFVAGRDYEVSDGDIIDFKIGN